MAYTRPRKKDGFTASSLIFREAPVKPLAQHPNYCTCSCHVDKVKAHRLSCCCPHRVTDNCPICEAYIASGRY